MKKFLVLLLTVSVIQAQAQHRHRYEDFLPQSVLGIGVSFQKFDGINSEIAKYPQYKTLRDQTGTLSLGWLNQKKQFISGFNLTGGSSLSGDRGKRSSNIWYLGLGGDFGYDVLKSKTTTLYPFVGLGYQWYNARLNKDNSGVPFDDVLQSPSVQNAIQSVGFKNEFFTYRAGVGIVLQSPKPDEGGIGLQLGYQGSFSDRAWRSKDNQTLGNAPKDGLGQFFVSLILTHKPMMMKHR